jgi:hypothetical protein
MLDRLYVRLNLPHIAELQNAGSSVENVAVELNRRGLTVMNRMPWDPQCVTAVVKRHEKIRASDLLHLGCSR